MPRWVCTPEQKEKSLSFIERSIKNANNMSDEEMEDVIRELRITSIKLNCIYTAVWYDENGDIDWEKSNLKGNESVLWNTDL